VCSPATGEGCSVERPVCQPSDDPTAPEGRDDPDCRICMDHAECSSGVCDLGSGACVPDQRIRWVDQAAVGLPADGSREAPFATLGAALAQFDGTDDGTDVAALRVREGVYAETILAQRFSVVVVGERLNARPRLEVRRSAGSIATVDGVRLVLDGIDVSGDGAVPALDVVDGSLVFARGILFNYEGGGIAVAGTAGLSIRNAIISRTGRAVPPTESSETGGSPDDDSGNAAASDVVAALRLEAGATADLVYSTLVGNLGTPGRATIACNGAVTLRIRNSVVVGEDAPSIDCSSAVIRNTLVDRDFDGEGVVVVDAYEFDWFESPLLGDFSLTAAGEARFREVARWANGDPLTDLFGRPRVTVDGTTDYAGAVRP